MAWIDAILGASQQRETKAEIIEHYRATYPARGHGSWKSRLVNDLAAITGMKPKNLERRFDPSRIEHVPRTAREKDQYKELGEQIAPKAPAGGFHITGTVHIRYSSDCEEREIDETVAGEDAQGLVDMAFADLAEQAIVNIYQGDTPAGEGYAPCPGDWDLNVTPLEE